MKYSLQVKFCDSHSILLINHAGLMKRLYCPFRVLCKGSIGDFKLNVTLWVEQVTATEKDELIYWILGKPYKHTDFEIKASF
jgi:hypothetical protein